MLTTGSLEVAASNVAQAKAWDGDEGTYWAAHAVRFDDSLGAYHAPFLAAAGVRIRDDVLDIGCGNGQTTIDAARSATAGTAFGIDLSAAMIAVAGQRAAAAGVTNVRFEQGDAQIYPFLPEFDVAISRTGAMFFGDLAAAFANIARALRPDGRLALLTWQPLAENEWLVEWAAALTNGRDLPAPPPGAPGPFSLSEPERVRELLASAGFRDVRLDRIEAPMYAGRDADDALAFVLGVAGWMADGLDHDERLEAHEKLQASIEAHQRGDAGGVLYGSAAWLITARKRRFS